MNLLLIVYLSFHAPTILEAQVHKDTVINWGSRMVTWADFRKAPPDSSARGKDLARTSSQTKIHYYIVNDSCLVYNVVAQFVTEGSWSITKSEYSLNHEQQHFDLAEVRARLLRKYFVDIGMVKCPSRAGINRGIDSIGAVGLALQDQYDRETNYGRDKVEQERWNKKIVLMLKSLEAYVRPKNVVIFKKARK